MDVKVKLAIAQVNDVIVVKEESAYKELLQKADELNKKYHQLSIGDVPGVSHARTLFKSIGIDPTKRRPSSEALLRRALKQKPFYSINNLVDIGNWCSLEFLLPICVYDAAKLSGKPKARLGSNGEGYTAIDNKHLDLTNRFLVCDGNNNPIGSPIKDSLKTRVTEETQSVILLIYSHGDFSTDVLDKYQNIFIERVLSICNGKLEYKEISEFKL